MSEEEKIRELLENREWRINNLYWIEDAWGNMVRFRMNWAQKKLFDCIDKEKHGRINVLKVRQLGISTFTAIFMTDLCLFGKNKHCGINDKEDDGAKEKLGKIRFCYDNLDHLPENPSEFDRAMSLIGAEIKATRKTAVRNEKLLKWNNDCSAKAGTNLRGTTIQFMHVSELAYVSANEPKKARKIVTGSINTVHAGNTLVVIESTHEGGKQGIAYSLTKQAMEMQGRELSVMDYKFFFFSWVDHPEYRLKGVKPRLNDELVKYFDSLEKQGIRVDEEQKAWYSAQYRQNGFYVRQEFPTTPEEAFEMPIEGAIFGKIISSLRAKGRVNVDFEIDALLPLYVSWDLGMSDATSLWLIQRIGQTYYAVDHYQASGVAIDHYIAKARQWEATFAPIVCHLLPHDAAHRDKQTGISYADCLSKAGIRNVRIVKRTPDTWAGINSLRMMLPHFIFHARCSDGHELDGVEYVSGVSALENYHTKEGGAICHDVFSHSADALRYFAEGAEQGLVEGGGFDSKPRKIKTITGRGDFGMRFT